MVAIFGSTFLVIVGAKYIGFQPAEIYQQIEDSSSGWRNQKACSSTIQATGALSIITSFAYIADAGFRIYLIIRGCIYS